MSRRCAFDSRVGGSHRQCLSDCNVEEKIMDHVVNWDILADVVSPSVKDGISSRELLAERCMFGVHDANVQENHPYLALALVRMANDSMGPDWVKKWEYENQGYILRQHRWDRRLRYVVNTSSGEGTKKLLRRR